MANVLIAFYSRDGATAHLADAIAAGAQAAGAATIMRRAREVVPAEVMAQVPGWAEKAAEMNERFEAPTPDDAAWADAIVLGSPTRFGLMASELKAYVDSLGGLWARGRLNGKVGSAFTATSTPHGGSEVTNLTMMVPMVHLGLIIVPPGYADAAMFGGGTPYGANAVVPAKASPRPGEAAMNAARFQGQRIAEVADALLRGRRAA